MDKDYNYDELFPGRFVKAGELKGRDVTLTIVNVELEEMPDKRAKGGKKNKPVLSFKETEKQYVLNPTNGGCLKGMFCNPAKPLASEWLGKRVTFFPTVVEAFGGQKPAIRVRGSPDIPHDMTFSYQCGQEQRTVTMKKTGKPGNGKAASAPAQQPPPPADDGALSEDPPQTDEAPLFADQ